MTSTSTEPNVHSPPRYSLLVGFIYLFNVIMGTGVLALPAAFQNAGWLMSILVLIILCFTSLISFTFIIEAMSISNAVNKLAQFSGQSEEHNAESRSLLATDNEPVEIDHTATPVHNGLFEIDEKYELSEMFKLFCGRISNILFYANLCIYLFGDLSIYAAGVPASLLDVTCDTNFTQVGNISDSQACWPGWALTRMDMYRIFVACFVVCIAPFMFCHVSRSKWLQIFTICIRWLAFLLMIVMAVERAIIIRLNPSGQEWINTSSWNPAVLSLRDVDSFEPIPRPALIRFEGIIGLFGTCVYAFMCHHSIPGIITPIRNKTRMLFRLGLPLFFFVIVVNLIISVTAVLAFNHVAGLYTLNFMLSDSDIEVTKLPYVIARIIGYFLTLYPVFAFSSVFPIIGTTLLGNLYTLFSMFSRCNTTRMQRVQKMGLPLLVLLIPTAIAMSTNDVGLLVRFTGAFAGSGIQYVIPSVLVYRARRHWADLCRQLRDSSVTSAELSGLDDSLTIGDLTDNTSMASSDQVPRVDYSCIKSPYASPFQGTVWIILLICWAVLIVILLFLNHVLAIH